MQPAAPTQNTARPVYLDMSGSVNDHLLEIVGVLSSLKAELTSIFLFSNKAVEVLFKTLLERAFDKAIILTDGYASLDKEKQEELKTRKTQVLTVLFGGRADCEEFAPLGDVAQLENVTE